MAIKRYAKTSFGIDVPQAYWRVEQVTVGKAEMQFLLRVYNDPSFAFFGEESRTAPYKIDGANPIEQAYEHLKTLPEFAGAIDC